MKDEKQKTTKDKNGKLSTYVVVMLLSIIIVIIIAAMADDREQQFQSQIESTTQANMTIQTEIVTLKDQNYTLNQEKENMQTKIDAMSAQISVYSSLTEILNLCDEGNLDEANKKFFEINIDSVPKECQRIYYAIQSILEEKQ